MTSMISSSSSNRDLSVHLRPLSTETFPLLSLPSELIVNVLLHMVRCEFSNFRNTLIAIPELKNLVICLTNCTEAASGILSGVQCVRYAEYGCIMSSHKRKKPLRIMILELSIAHRGEKHMSLDLYGLHPLLDRFHRHLCDTVVEQFIALGPHETGIAQLIKDSKALETAVLKDVPVNCTCPVPVAYKYDPPYVNPLVKALRAVGVAADREHFVQCQHLRPSGDDWEWKLYLTQSVFSPTKHSLIKIVSIDIKCKPLTAADCKTENCIVELQAPELETLTVKFWTLQCPFVRDLCLEQRGYGSQECSGGELVLHNMNWSTLDPCCSTLTHSCRMRTAGYHDALYCSTACLSFEDYEDWHRPLFMFESCVLVGIPDLVLELALWEGVKRLYWKRLEPVFTRQRSGPFWINCPSLTHLKVFHLVSNRVYLLRFIAPSLKELVLVPMPNSESDWNIIELLSNRWPPTLRKLTLSPDTRHTGNRNQLLTRMILPSDVPLMHICIQRLDFLAQMETLVTNSLVYVDFDVAAITHTGTGTETAVRITLTQQQCPSLRTLILSVPLLCVEDWAAGTPIFVDVPEKCVCIGVATMLSTSNVSVNSQVLPLPPNFIQRPHIELFSRYTREYGLFVPNGEMMAANGEPVDLLIESPDHNFAEKVHCA